MDKNEKLLAFVHMAMDDEHGLEQLGLPLPLAKEVVAHLARRGMPIPALLERIKNSCHEGKLLEYLPKVIGTSLPVLNQMLGYLRTAVHEDKDSWERDSLRLVSDQYWQLRVLDRIAHGEYRRAWEDIKKSFRGFHDGEEAENRVPFETYPHGEATDFAASLKMIRTLVATLYGAMLEKKLIEQVHEEPAQIEISEERRIVYTVRPRSDSGTLPRPRVFTNLEIAGVEFAYAINEASGGFDAQSQMALRIAAYFAQQRREKRRQKYEAELAQLQALTSKL